MGNMLTFSKLSHYQGFEGGALAICLAFIIAMVIGVIIYLCVHKCCKCCNCDKAADKDRLTQEGHKVEDNAHNAHNARTREKAHALLATVFPLFIQKKYYIRPSGTKEKESLEIDENTTYRIKEVLLFGDGELVDKADDVQLPECFTKKCKCETSCIHCCAYSYFLVVLLLAVVWFVVMTIENSIYRKTAICNDIDVDDHSFTCFNQSRGVVNCSDDIVRRKNSSVICYLLSPNPGAVGIAYGVVQLIIFGVVVYFKIISAIGRSPSCCPTRYPSCCQCAALCIQCLLIGVLIVVIFILPAVHFTGTVNEVYFFHGGAVLRWTIYVLLAITGFALIPIPWCCFNVDKYKDMVLDVSPPVPKDGMA